MLNLTRYQWTVLLAAWLGWGFDVFDALLFNYVAPNCIPVLLNLTPGSAEAKAAIPLWNGILTSILLIGWAVGGVLFGAIADRIGRTRTLLLTMALYALGTAACALAPNIWVLIACRIVASLGIGGEWAAGASMVAETVPEKSRVSAGALLYTASPLGLLLATFVNYQVAGKWFADSPEVSWRYVFLFGLIPAAIAFIVRRFVHEPEQWQNQSAARARIADLFTREIRPLTASGATLATLALLTWWSCNAFLPTIMTSLAHATAEAQGLDRSATLALVENWKLSGTLWFNFGGFVGILISVPIAERFGRRAMFAVYFLYSSIAMLVTFGIDLPAAARVYGYFAVGIGIYGVCGTFTYYLPELFPTRLRATGSGFSYNIGRVVAAIGPPIVGAIAARGEALQALFYLGFVPLAGLLLMPWIVETKHRKLA